MLVKFISSQSGEILMFADAARVLLTMVGKQCTARGVFSRDEMLPAAILLQRHVKDKIAGAGNADAREGEDRVQVTLDQRAWPLIDMLLRTASGDKSASIVWEASADF